MKIISKLLLSLTLAVSAVTGTAVAAPVALDVGTYSGSGCCGAGLRGYWFTAPKAFRITGLALPTGAAGGAGSTLEVLRFNSAVPSWTNTTNDFASLGFWADQSSVSTDISVNAGDIIGVLGYSGGNGFSPYSTTNGNYATTLDGMGITLQRLGMQFRGQAHDVWTELGTIATIGLTYDVEARSTVPEPATLALVALALAGAGLGRSQRRR